MRTLLLASLLALTLGCGDDDVPPFTGDSGTGDTGVRDSGGDDGGGTDGGGTDGGGSDAATDSGGGDDGGGSDSGGVDSGFDAAFDADPGDAGMCIEEGGSQVVAPGAPPCCVGLAPIPCDMPGPGGGCMLCAGSAFCADCGNGTCDEPWENRCNCEADCF